MEALMRMMGGGGGARGGEAEAPADPPLIAWARGSMSVDAIGGALEDGGDLNAVDHRGLSALHHLALSGATRAAEAAEGARFLLGLGADPRLQDPQGRTPLSLACDVGCEPLCEALQAADPDCVDVADVNGMTPIHWACRRSMFALAVRLAGSEDEETATRRLSQGDADGTTPMHWAAFHGDRAGVEALLAKKINPTPLADGALAPFEVAMRRKHQETAEFLLLKSDTAEEGEEREEEEGGEEERGEEEAKRGEGGEGSGGGGAGGGAEIVEVGGEGGGGGGAEDTA